MIQDDLSTTNSRSTTRSGVPPGVADLTCRSALRLRDGRTASAVDLQRSSQLAHRLPGPELDPVTKDVLVRWEQVLDRLAQDPMSLRGNRL
jgi:proteasome accessory factor A